MRRLLTVLACLMLVLSLGATATAHALERPDSSGAANAGSGSPIAGGHVPDDSDQVPADGSKGYPHHHGGCHGDHVAAPVKVVLAVSLLDVRLAPVPAGGFVRPRSTADPTLRPPRA